MTTRTSEMPAWYEGLSEPRLVSGQPSDATVICHDNRQAIPGAVFVAVPGQRADGNAYIADAIKRGALSVIVQENLAPRWEPLVSEDVAFVAVADARVALAEAAAGFYRHPARTMGVVGITGTDGKTTTTHLTSHVLSATGQRAGFLSSVEFGVGDATELNASHMTTLEADEVQRYLARIREAGGRYAVVEASSIGLDMHRVDQCEFDVGVFTNLAPDHLDYHGSMAAYRDAKAILFRMLGASVEKGVGKAAILNDDDPASGEMARVTEVPVITYGLTPDADLSASDIKATPMGMEFDVHMFSEEVRARLPLLGEYNVSNALAAIAVAVSQNVRLRHAVAALESFRGVPGRMEQIDEGQPFRVIVDIASTEQAMRNVLRILRQVTRGKVIVVFGAAGERDVARRRGIARAVADAAHFAVVTNEDPRTEDPETIVDEIAAALRSEGWGEGRKFVREIDRRQAISLAFSRAGKGDTVLLAGKGTEQSIVIGNVHWPWDERRIARECLQELHGA